MAVEKPVKVNKSGLFAGFWLVLPRVFKYQLVTKPLLAGVILPLHGLILAALVAERGAITNATLGNFLLSWRGAGFLALMLLLVLVSIAIELSGFITICARSRHGQPEASYLALLRHSFSRMPNLLSLGTPLLLLDLMVFSPLISGESSVSVLAGVTLPNFVTSFIESDEMLSAIYYGLLLFLLLANTFFMYSLHLIVIGDFKAGPALAASVRLVWRAPGIVFKTAFKAIGVSMIIFTIVLLWLILVMTLVSSFGVAALWMKILLALLLIVQYLAVGLFAMLTVPYSVNLITVAFYEALPRVPALAHVAQQYPSFPGKEKPSLLDRILTRKRAIIIFGTVTALIVSVPAGIFFNEIFRDGQGARIVAHRAGGNSAPENSIAGLNNAVRLGVDYVEIDVQRTADGAYVLNHDETFSRVAGVTKAVDQMTLAEVKQLDISVAKDGSERVPTLEEFLLAARDRVKVMIELKGHTADRRMADEVSAIVKKLDIVAQSIIMSLDYDLVVHLETNYPELSTGFCYFLSFGDVTKLMGDYIIMEEGEATDARISALNQAGKKPVVWTVNTPESMQDFAVKPVDAIITDNMAELQQVLSEVRSSTPEERYLRVFFGVGAPVPFYR